MLSKLYYEPNVEVCINGNLGPGRVSPAWILCLRLRGWRRKKMFPGSLLVGELCVSAVAAGFTVGVGRHEHSGAALGAHGLGPDELVSLDLVGVLLGDDLGCIGLLCCHFNHSSAGASASALGASIPFLFRRYSLSSCRAASLDS